MSLSHTLGVLVILELGVVHVIVNLRRGKA